MDDTPSRAEAQRSSTDGEAPAVRDAVSAREHQQAGVAALSMPGSEADDDREFSSRVVAAIRRELPAQFVEVLQLLPDGEALRRTAGSASSEDLNAVESTLSAEWSLLPGYTLMMQEPVITADLSNEQRFAVPPWLLEHGLRSSISVVIGPPAQPFGVLAAHSTDEGRYTRADIPFVQALANLLWQTLARRRCQQQLQQAEGSAQLAVSAKREFLTSVSHEVRSPLTAILGYADLLLQTSDDIAIRKPLRQIRQNARHLLGMVNDVLDLSRGESGTLDIQRRRFSPAELMLELDASMRTRAEQKGVQLLFSTSGKVPESIASDPVRVRQILVNLIGNAIKYTHQGSVRVNMSLREEREPRLRIEVIDTGIGMDADQLQRMFQPFEQGDQPARSGRAGVGLGLTICQRLIALLDGELEFESAPDRGSIFVVSLPTGSLDGVGRVHLADKPAPKPAAAGTLDCRVLVVDDIDYVADILSACLKRAGARVSVAHNGAQCLEAVASAHRAGRPFDAVILDMMMPVMDGYEAVTRLRERGFQSPVIAVTAAAMPEDRERCLAAGCDAYLSKPVDMVKLFEILRQRVIDA